MLFHACYRIHLRTEHPTGRVPQILRARTNDSVSRGFIDSIAQNMVGSSLRMYSADGLDVFVDFSVAVGLCLHDDGRVQSDLPPLATARGLASWLEAWEFPILKFISTGNGILANANSHSSQQLDFVLRVSWQLIEHCGILNRIGGLDQAGEAAVRERNVILLVLMHLLVLVHSTP